LLEEVRLDKYESALKQQKAGRLPSLSLFYQANQNWATDNFLDFSEAQRLPQQAFGVTLSMSGLLNLTTHQKVKQSQWKLELQQQQLENVQWVAQKEDEMLQLQFEQAFNQLAENRQILSLQEENDVHAENQYQAGIMSLDTRLDRYDDLLAAQDRFLQSLAEYSLAQYKIFIRKIDFRPTETN
jgi:outer membrane protein TolC